MNSDRKEWTHSNYSFITMLSFRKHTSDPITTKTRELRLISHLWLHRMNKGFKLSKTLSKFSYSKRTRWQETHSKTKHATAIPTANIQKCQQPPTIVWVATQKWKLTTRYSKKNSINVSSRIEPRTKSARIWTEINIKRTQLMTLLISLKSNINSAFLTGSNTISARS